MLETTSQPREMSAHIPTMGDKAVGRRIKAARLAAGVTQAQMARDLGVTSVTALRWEKGESGVSLEKLRRIAELLKVPVEQLVPDADSSDEEPIADDPEEMVRFAKLALDAAHSPPAKEKFNKEVVERARRLRAAKLRHADEG